MNHLGDTNKMVGEDHIRDATKMVSDTPRTEAEVNRQKCWSDDLVTIDANFACQLERELNEANDRIKRLEEAGDFLSRYLREMPYASDYLAQVDERILRISNWRRAKEDNL